MSWKSIAGNQTVSRANLQNAIDTGVFIQKNGVPGTEPNREITKANAQDYVNTWELYPPFRNKTSNQLPVKSNLAVQSNIVYAVPAGDPAILIGNTNRNWLCYIGGFGGANWGFVASSTDNVCILGGKRHEAGNENAYLSIDCGESFTRLDTIITNNDSSMAGAMSQYGNYIIVTRQVGAFGSQRAYIYLTQNFGVSWQVGYHDSVDYNFNGAAMSSSGIYATVLGSDGGIYYVWTSTSFGTSYIRTDLCSGVKQLVGDCVGMSKSGQYQLLTPPKASAPDVGKCFLSTDYGNTWTSFYLTAPPVIAYDLFIGCSVSGAGDYMTIVGQSSVSGNTRTFISNDFGVTWSMAPSDGYSYGNIAQAVDSSGQFQYQSTRASIDYGNTWTRNETGAYGISVNSTTYTTPYIYGVLNGTAYPVVSTDQGVTFSSLSSGIGVGNYNDIACSGGANNGKYVVVISANTSGYSYLLSSSDYGATFTTLTYYGGTNEFKRVSISDDGNHILAALYDSSTQRSTLLYSAYGSAFTAVTIDGYTYVDGEINALCMAKNGANSGGFTVYKQSNNTSYLYRTTTHTSAAFNNWTYTGYSSPTTKYNDISCSGFGKFMTMVSRDNADNSGRVYYSNNYGVNWSERLYWGAPNGRYSGLYCDNSGLNGVAIAGGIDYLNQRSITWITTDYWATYTAVYFPFLLVNLIGGINISTDGTYWTLVASNRAHTYTNSSGIANNFTENQIESILDFKRISK